MSRGRLGFWEYLPEELTCQELCHLCHDGQSGELGSPWPHLPAPGPSHPQQWSLWSTSARVMPHVCPLTPQTRAWAWSLCYHHPRRTKLLCPPLVQKSSSSAKAYSWPLSAFSVSCQCTCLAEAGHGHTWSCKACCLRHRALDPVCSSVARCPHFTQVWNPKFPMGREWDQFPRASSIKDRNWTAQIHT